MELGYSPRRARRVQANFTAPSSPTLTPCRSPSTPLTANLSHSEYRTTREFKFITDVSGQLRPLRLPPRLSPCSTPPRPQGNGRTTAPTRSCLLRLGNSKNKDVDPFAAALERIRKDDGDRPPHDQRTESLELASRSSPLVQCAYSGKAHHKGGKAGFLASVRSNSNKKRVFEVDESTTVGWMQNGNYSFNSRLEMVKKENRSAASAVYKQRLLACFGFKK